MTADEVGKILKETGVPDHYYSIGRPISTECTVLQKRESEWITFIWERGQENFVKRFPDEHSAASSFLETVLKVFKMSKKIYIG